VLGPEPHDVAGHAPGHTPAMPSRTPSAPGPIGRVARDDAVAPFVAAAYERHHEEVFAVAALATRDTATAEVILRESFRSLASDVRSRPQPQDVRRWLLRVAAQLAIKDAERPGRRDPPASISDTEQVLAGLSPDARLALVLSARGLTGPEIAETIGRSLEATRNLLALARARVRIRSELARPPSP
jgi:DNA-directed RNA polymerase specialized sigma24 family protein